MLKILWTIKMVEYINLWGPKSNYIKLYIAFMSDAYTLINKCWPPHIFHMLNWANVMKSTNYGCDVRWIKAKMFQSSWKSIEISSDYKTYCINVSETPKLIKRVISHYLTIAQWKRWAACVFSCLSNLEDLNDMQMHSIFEIDSTDVAKHQNLSKKTSAIELIKCDANGSHECDVTWIKLNINGV